jgi:hypothetical protein
VLWLIRLEKLQLQFVYRWVHYKNVVLLSGCLFGIGFICVCNTASNCIGFAINVLNGAQPGIEPSSGQIRGIAIAAAAVACSIHAVSRRGGILLANFLAIVKIGILLVIVTITLIVLSGSVKDREGNAVPNVFLQNMDPKVAFRPPASTAAPTTNTSPVGTANGYAAAFLSISEPHFFFLVASMQAVVLTDESVFAYSGFDQANCVGQTRSSSLTGIDGPDSTVPRD